MPTPDLVAEICVGKNIMKRRFTALMTTLILSVIFSISASAYDVEVDGIYYLIPKKNLAIVTSGDKKYSGNIVSIRQTPSCKCHEVFSENFGDSQRYL